MEKLLCTALFFTGMLLAACNWLAAPVYADASARRAAVAGPGCYLAREADGSFVLHSVDPATRRDTPVSRAAGERRADGSRDARFCWGGLEFTARQNPDGQLALRWAAPETK